MGSPSQGSTKHWWGLPRCRRPAAEWSKTFKSSNIPRYLTPVVEDSRFPHDKTLVIVPTSQAFHQPLLTSLHHQSFSRLIGHYQPIVAIMDQLFAMINQLLAIVSPLLTNCSHLLAIINRPLSTIHYIQAWHYLGICYLGNRLRLGHHLDLSACSRGGHEANIAARWSRNCGFWFLMLVWKVAGSG